MSNGHLHLVTSWDGETFLDVFHSGEYHERCFSSRNNEDRPDYIHIFFDMPKRRDELLGGGSIYWVINGFIQIRSGILKINDDGMAITTRPRATVWQQFQPATEWDKISNWDYLAAEDAPADLDVFVTKSEDVPLAMREKYQELNCMDWFG